MGSISRYTIRMRTKCWRARAQEAGHTLSTGLIKQGFRLQLAIAAPLRRGEMAASSDAPTKEELRQLYVSPLV